MPRKADPSRRDAILDAAAAVFARKGYAAARIIEVARAAGVGKGTIYEYFPSKEALFFAVFEAMMRAAGDEVSALAQELEGSFDERMAHLSDRMIQTWLDRLDVYALVMEFWSATASSPSRDRFKAVFQEGYRHLRSVVGGLIRDAQRTGEAAPACDPRQVAAGLLGIWDALLLQAWLDPDFDALAASRGFLAVVLRGLRSAPEGSSS